MFELIKRIIIGLLAVLVNGSNHTKCVSLSNQQFMTYEYSKESHYSSFAVKLDRCVGSHNTINDFPNKVCVPNKAEDLNLSMFNMITGINESKNTNKAHIMLMQM